MIERTDPGSGAISARIALDGSAQAIIANPSGKTYSAMALAGGALWASWVQGGLVETASGRVAEIYPAPA